MLICLFFFKEMGKNCELTVAMRSQIIGLRKGGHTMQNISKLLNLPIGTVKTTIRRYGDSAMPKSPSAPEKFTRIRDFFKARMATNST